jgi:hypothetical protein
LNISVSTAGSVHDLTSKAASGVACSNDKQVSSKHTPAHASTREHTSAYVSIRQNQLYACRERQIA